MNAQPDPEIGDRPSSGDEVLEFLDATILSRSLKHKLFGAAYEPVLVGRYVVERRIGAGAMGIVYLAHDEELERRIALKLLSTRDRDVAHVQNDHLIREARAMAKLSHPNVVQVYDVGVYEGRVFLAMELVQGPNLRTWLATKSRQRSEIVEAFAQVARGVQAAHDAGIVHGDIKPENVFVGLDGRVRVGDFGMAKRWLGDPDGDDHDGDQLNGTVAMDIDDWTSRIGGTPAYMAPEQVRLGVMNARSDQFSYCVALYEALFGERPHTVWTQELILEQPAVHKHLRTLDRRLRRVLLRGLAADPEARFASMAEVAAALSGSRRIRRTTWLSAGLAGGVAAGGLGLQLLAERPCQNVGEPWTRTWNVERQDEVRAAFARTQVPFAANAFAEVDRKLRAYGERWQQVAADSCEATLVANTQPSRTHERRSACLERARHSADALLTEFERIDAGAMRHATTASEGLFDLAQCERQELLSAQPDLPAGAQAKARVTEVMQALDRVVAFDLLGRHKAATALVEATLPAAAATGHPPTHALALRLYARQKQEHPEVARPLFVQALGLAIASHDDGLAADLWTDLVFMAGRRSYALSEGHEWIALAEAAIARVGGDERRTLQLEFAAAGLHATSNDLARAERAYRHVAASIDDDATPRLVASYRALGDILRLRGERDQAEAALHRAVTEAERILGTEHPITGDAWFSLGQLQMENQQAAAAATLDRAELIWRAAYDANDVRFAALAETRASLAKHAGDYVAMERHAEQAADIHRAYGGDDNPALVLAYNRIGNAAQLRRDHAKARDYHERALSVHLRAPIPDEELTAIVRTNLAYDILRAGEPRRAKDLYLAAIAEYERAQSSRHLVAYASKGLAEIAALEHDTGTAEALLRWSLEAWETTPGDASDEAEAHWQLARAIERNRGNLHEAQHHAQLAYAWFSHQDGNPTTNAIDTWTREIDDP